MKTLNEVEQNLKALHGTVFDFNPYEVDQGSPEWLSMKLGVISASNAAKVIAGPKTATRNTYMCDLVSQIATREMPILKAAPLAWGTENELAARATYEFETNRVVTEVPFIYKDADMRCGVSPDGYGDRGLELKCPFTSSVFFQFACAQKIKPEEMHQVQFQMWVSGAEIWDFAKFDPRSEVKQFHLVEIERDEKAMIKFDEMVPEFIKDMDDMLNVLGIKFGFQWNWDFNA